MTGKADKGRYTRKKSDTKFTAVKGERVISKLAVAFTAPHSLRSRKNLYVKFVPLYYGEGNGTHSSVLAWRIPGTGEPGGLLSMGSHRVGHD